MTLSFVKYEGLGNDFVVVDEAAWLASGLGAVEVCDRHRGVGADGVLLVGRGQGGAVASMVVLNADGSRPEMCGNGLRCVARYLVDEGRQPAGVDFDVTTDSGARGCRVSGDDVTVAMGEARLEGEVAAAVGAETVSLLRVSMGNPHAVTFAPLPFEALAPSLAVHEVFPQGANVEFVTDRGEGPLEVRVWERGVGPTLACGTGACAVAAAAWATGRRGAGDEVTVRLPGGDLRIRGREGGHVTMQGPARRVFAGQLAGREAVGSW